MRFSKKWRKFVYFIELFEKHTHIKKKSRNKQRFPKSYFLQYPFLIYFISFFTILFVIGKGFLNIHSNIINNAVSYFF